MIYENITYNEVFIDPSAAEAGTGASATSPLNALPYPLVSNTAYIIRRTSSDSEVFVQQQIDDNLTNVAFIGMPKSTDPQWIKNLVSDATWLNDTADYANVKFFTWALNESGYNENGIISGKNVHFFGLNCFMYKDKYRVAPYQTQCNKNNPMFSNNNPDSITADNSNFNFYGCKFGAKNIDLENDTWLENHNISDYDNPSTYDYPTQRSKCYISGSYIHKVSLKNCLINNINDYGNDSSTSWQTGNAFSFPYINILEVEDCSINAIGSNNNISIDQVFYVTIPNNGSNCFDIYFNNITYNQILRGEYSIKTLLYLHSPSTSINIYNPVSSFIFTNITENLKKVRGLTSINALTETTYQHPHLINTYMYSAYTDPKGYTFGNQIISNINFNARTGNIKLISASVIKTAYLNQGSSVPHKNVFSNINIQFAENLEDCFVKTALDVPILFIQGIKGLTTAGNLTVMGSLGFTPQSGFKFENVYVDAKKSGFCTLIGVTANLDTFNTALDAQGYNSIQINNMSTIRNTYSLYLRRSQNFIRVKNLHVYENLETEATLIDSSPYNNVLYVDSCNQEEVFDTVLTTNTSNEYRNWQLTCANAGDTGKFISRNQTTIAQSWSVTRNGSDSSASLRLSCPQTNAATYFQVCNRDQGGFEVTPTVIGNQDLKIYFAYTSFTQSDEDRGRDGFYVIIDIPHRDSNNKLYYVSKNFARATWYTDNSTWTDPSAIARYMKFNITTTTLDPIIVRPVYNWYSSTGVVYMDPDIKLIPAV